MLRIVVAKSATLYDTNIFVSRILSDRVTDFQAISSRICTIRIKMEPHNITVISVHAPTEEKEEEEKMDFYTDLEKTYDEAPRFSRHENHSRGL